MPPFPHKKKEEKSENIFFSEISKIIPDTEKNQAEK